MFEGVVVGELVCERKKITINTTKNLEQTCEGVTVPVTVCEGVPDGVPDVEGVSLPVPVKVPVPVPVGVPVDVWVAPVLAVPEVINDQRYMEPDSAKPIPLIEGALVWVYDGDGVPVGVPVPLVDGVPAH